VELESGKRATGIKNVSMSEDFLAHHFPGMPIMPGTLIIESLVQLADWIIREHSGFEQIGLATAFRRIKFRRMVRPGDQLRLEVALVSWDENQVTAVGKAFCQDKIVTTVEFTLGLRPLDRLLACEEARRQYELIRTSPDGRR
jgi:3-hydroxyacyl-[acyl-carrier-protein] dehydratase